MIVIGVHCVNISNNHQNYVKNKYIILKREFYIIIFHTERKKKEMKQRKRKEKGKEKKKKKQK